MSTQGLRILAAGIDSLYASVRGELKDGLTLALAATKDLPGDDPKVVCYREQDGNFLLRSHGWRGYPFWLSCPRFELFIGAIKPFPPAYAALHSAYLHTVGVDAAVADLKEEMTAVYFGGEVVVSPSRVDVYADVQGWEPTPEDFDRFACRGVRRRLYEQPRELHGAGRALSGFTFGKGSVVARIYNKTLEMATRGATWQETLWQNRDPDFPVWRVEFQFRRKALTSFGIASMATLLANRQALWEYGCQWLSLRVPNTDPNRSRWPEASAWQAIRGAEIGSPASPLIRERIHQADERRLVSGFVGYVSSLAAMHGGDDVGIAIRRALPLADRYLNERGVQFHDVVERKRALRSTRVRGATARGTD